MGNPNQLGSDPAVASGRMKNSSSSRRPQQVEIVAARLDEAGQFLQLGIGLRFGVPAGALLAVVVLISFGLILGKSESLSGRFAAAILAGLLLSPHTYWQDYSLAAIVALVTRYPPIRYALLIPWPYFYPSLDVLPFTMVSLAAISISAVGDVLKREPRKVT